MTEATPPGDPEKGKAAVAAAELAAETMGRDLLSALVDELKAAPDCWDKMSQQDQDQTIERLRRRITKLVQEALGLVFRGEYPAVRATVAGVRFKKGITASLQVERGAYNRHELADAEGQQVLIVMANPDDYLARMEEIRAADKQGDLFPAGESAVSFRDGYTGGDDRPYRRGEPAATEETEDGPKVEYDPDAPAPELTLENDPLWVQAQKALATVGVLVDDTTAQSWTDEQCTEAAYWVTVTKANPDRPVPRPTFLPEEPAAE